MSQRHAMCRAYYNEFDQGKAEWLRNLIRNGVIAEGDVDERDIREVQAADLTGYTQCHFFAGIGGWSIALRLAGWPDERPVWTGSPPCQPFSQAGKGLGVKDERHLAPVWLRLIEECLPPVVFGEQVAKAVTKDRWLDSVLDALEGAGYACGAAVVPGCSVGAFQQRQRLWFVADREETRWPDVEWGARPAEQTGRYEPVCTASNGMVRHDENGRKTWCDTTRALGYRGAIEPAGWYTDLEWLHFNDGRSRPIKSGLCPVVDGVHGNPLAVGAYGDAIVPQVAAEVIAAYMHI